MRIFSWNIGEIDFNQDINNVIKILKESNSDVIALQEVNISFIQIFIDNLNLYKYSLSIRSNSKLCCVTFWKKSGEQPIKIFPKKFKISGDPYLIIKFPSFIYINVSRCEAKTSNLEHLEYLELTLCLENKPTIICGIFNRIDHNKVNPNKIANPLSQLDFKSVYDLILYSEMIVISSFLQDKISKHPYLKCIILSKIITEKFFDYDS